MTSARAHELVASELLQIATAKAWKAKQHWMCFTPKGMGAVYCVPSMVVRTPQGDSFVPWGCRNQKENSTVQYSNSLTVRCSMFSSG